MRVAVTVDVAPERLWQALSDIATHVRWMADAREITFTSASRAGVGTTFECLTVIGPFRLTDVMEVTEWNPPAAMGIRHVGLVTGTGRFTVSRTDKGHSRFAWEERLRFPWFLGGRVGALAARPVLGFVWRSNLRRLKSLVESGQL